MGKWVKSNVCFKEQGSFDELKRRPIPSVKSVWGKFSGWQNPSIGLGITDEE
jgi:hypothetical protein